VTYNERMQIQQVDPATADDRVLAQVHAIEVAVGREQYPDDEPIALEELVASLRNLPKHLVLHWWVAFDGDRAVGKAALDYQTVAENRHIADANVRVLAEYRRRGIASQLLRQLAAHAQQEGRRILQMGAREGSGGEAFLAAIGGQKKYVEHHNRLRVDDIDRQLLEGWVKAAADEAAGYSLLTWDGPTPAEHLAAFASLLDVMNDAPRGDLDMEDERNTPETVKGWEDSVVARGQTIWTVVARHDATGALAGWSTLLFPMVRKEVTYQLGTGVSPEHRGHGLGRWLKAVNALRLLDEKPAVRRIETENATSNGPMLAINNAMGFRSFETSGWWEVASADLAAR